MQRIVALLDMDFFYAQIEARENPLLQNVPVVVGMYSGRSADSGAVATCNYLARSLGIKSGMPLGVAKHLAAKNPKTVFVPVRKEFYKQVSDRIMAIVRSVSSQMEVVGLDEGYFELSDLCQGDFGVAEKTVALLQKRIFEEEHLTCSIGLGPNKLVAKLACDSKKPNGITVVLPSQVQSFLDPLPPKKLLGVGPKTEEKLNENKIRCIGDLRLKSLVELQGLLGTAKGKLLFDSSRGIDDSSIEADWKKRELSKIKTLPNDAFRAADVTDFVKRLSGELFISVKAEGCPFRTVSILAVSDRLESFSKMRTLAAPAKDQKTIEETALQLVEAFFDSHESIVVRRMGVRVGGLVRNDSVLVPEKPQPRLSDF